MGSERDQASRSLMWSCIDAFSQTGLSIVSLVYLARELSVVEIGIGALAVATTQMVALPLEILFQDALIRQQPLEQRHVGSAFTLTLIGAVTAALLLILAAPLIAHAYHLPQLKNLLQVAALSIPFSATTAVVGSLLRRAMSFAPLARRTLIGRVSGVVIGIVIAAMGGGAWALVVMYAASIVLSTCILLIEWRERPPLQTRAIPLQWVDFSDGLRLVRRLGEHILPSLHAGFELGLVAGTPRAAQVRVWSGAGFFRRHRIDELHQALGGCDQNHQLTLQAGV